MKILNKKARFNYEILEEKEAGIVLTGTEIKSIRQGKAQISESFVRIKKEEAYIMNMHISKYEEGNRFNHDETRERKLLLHKREIKKLSSESQKDGISLIPTSLYIKNGKAKISVAVGKGKKLYDKKEVIKKRDAERTVRKYI
ncbi:MAG: SsrA-binding protein SmpB [bacterium]